MVVDYMVKQVSYCPVCEGEGWITNPEWEPIFQKYRNPTMEQIMEWWKEKGYLSEYDIPPEEIPCPRCNGKGKTEKWISLRTALRRILREQEFVE